MKFPAMTTFLLCFLSLILAAQANVIDQAMALHKFIEEKHPGFYDKCVVGYLWDMLQATFDQNDDGLIQLSGKQRHDYLLGKAMFASFSSPVSCFWLIK